MNLDYERDGLLLIRQFLSAGELSEVERELRTYTETIVPTLPASDIVYEANGKSIRNLWRMEKYSPYFDRLSRTPRIVGLIGELVHGQPVVCAVELFAKPPRVGSAVPIHQDNGYFNLDPPDALTLWIALDESTEENGCVRYARGSHRGGLLPHKASLVPGNSWGLAKPPEASTLDEVKGLLAPGDAMIHNCCTLHWSLPNLTDRARRGLLVVCKAAHCEVDHTGMDAYLAALHAQQKANEKNGFARTETPYGQKTGT